MRCGARRYAGQSGSAHRARMNMGDETTPTGVGFTMDEPRASW